MSFRSKAPRETAGLLLARDALACCRGRSAYDSRMAHLPNSELAILDIRKIEDYCLNPLHPRGRHKAHLFRELLGITQPVGWVER
jgi:hypothetical protein